MILLEIKALYREFFENKNHIKMVSFVGVAVFLFDYALSVVGRSYILAHDVFLCNLLILLGGLGLFSRQSLFLKYFFKKAEELLKFPHSLKKLLFFKSIKYEVLNISAYLILLSYLIFPILINKLTLYGLFSMFNSLFLYLSTNKLSQLFQSRKTKISFINFVISILGNLCFILMMYFSYSRKNFLSFSYFEILKGGLFTRIADELNVYLLFIFLVASYVLLFLLLIRKLSHSIKQKGTKENKEITNNWIIVKNPMIKKQLRELKENSVKFKLKSVFSSQIVSIVMMKILTRLKVIEIDNLNLCNLFAVVLAMVMMFIMGGAIIGLKQEGRRIIQVIQAGYSINKVIYTKIKLLFFMTCGYSFGICVTFLVCGFIKFITLLQILPLIFLNILVLSVMVNLYSNLFVKYTQNETFEETLSLVISSFCIFGYIMLEELPMLLVAILGLSQQLIYGYVVIISFVFLVVNLILIRFLKRRFYGNYKKFVK